MQPRSQGPLSSYLEEPRGRKREDPGNEVVRHADADAISAVACLHRCLRSQADWLQCCSRERRFGFLRLILLLLSLNIHLSEGVLPH